jgi:hypothetical protein
MGTGGSHGKRKRPSRQAAEEMELPARIPYPAFRAQERAKADKRMSEVKDWDFREKLIAQLGSHSEG